MLRVSSLCSQRLLEYAVHVVEIFGAEGLAGVHQGEDGFDARGTPRQQRNGPRGGNGGHRGVAAHFSPAVRIGSPFLGEAPALVVSHTLDLGHDPLSQGQGLFGIVGHPELEEHFRPSHDPQADLAVALTHVPDLRQGIAVDVDDVVQKAHPEADRFFQSGLVHGVVRRHHVRQIHGAEIARFVGEEGLFAAGVRGDDASHVGRGVVPVQAVGEDHPGISRGPGAVHDAVEELPGGEGAHRSPRAGVFQRPFAVPLQSLPEVVRKAHGDVEVREFSLFGLDPDEFQHVGMVRVQNAHVGPPAGAPLLHHVRGQIEHAHEGHGARGHPVGAAHHVPGGAQGGEVEPRAASGLVDEGGVLERGEDLLHAVPHGEDKARRKLSLGGPRVHEGGRVGEEVQALHDGKKAFLPKGARGFGFRSGEGPGHAPEQAFGGLLVFEVPFLENGQGVFGKRHQKNLLCTAPGGAKRAPEGQGKGERANILTG